MSNIQIIPQKATIKDRTIVTGYRVAINGNDNFAHYRLLPNDMWYLVYSKDDTHFFETAEECLNHVEETLDELERWSESFEPGDAHYYPHG